MWKEVIRSDESSLLSTSGRVHVWRTPRERYRPECLTTKVRGSGGSVMLWGAFCWHGLGPLKSKLFWMIIFILMGVDSSRMIVPPSIGPKGSRTGSMSRKMMWIIHSILLSQQISTQLNTCGRCWTDVLDSAHHHHHQNTKGVISFWKNGVHPSRRAPETFRLLLWQHMVAQHVIKTLNVRFTHNSSSVCMWWWTCGGSEFLFFLCHTDILTPWLRNRGLLLENDQLFVPH